MTDYAAPSGTGHDTAACLCCMCGTVSLERDWTYWQYDDEGELRPSCEGESDPMMLCPVCGWEHRDTDDGSGVYTGTVAEMEAQREADLPDCGDGWAERLAEVRVTEAAPARTDGSETRCERFRYAGVHPNGYSLICVGERDKAEIERLRAALEPTDSTDTPRSGAAEFVAFSKAWVQRTEDATPRRLRATLGDALEYIERQAEAWERDRQHIAQLTEALPQWEQAARITARSVADSEPDSYSTASYYRGRASAFRDIAAVLAGEEDADA